MTTDTPRTDAAKSFWDSAERENCVSIVLARELERELKNAQEAYLKSVERDDYLTQGLAASQAEVERLDHLLADASETNHKLAAEVERLKEMVMEAARKGDELLEPFRLRAEKAETLIKQIHAFVSALNPTSK
jgi:hypothetical protein